MNFNLEDIENTNKVSATILLIAGIALLLMFVYFIMPFLSPIVLFIAILFLFYPLRHNTYVNRLMWLVGLLFIVWLSSSLIGVLTPFILAFFLAYILNPLVDILEKKNIPRWTSSLTIMLVLIGLVTLFFMLIMPIVLYQFRGIIENVSNFIVSTVDSFKQGTFFDTLRQSGLPVDSIRESIEKELPKRLDAILKSLLEGAFSFITSISIVITQLLNIVIIPFVVFYLLKDFPIVLQSVKSFFPEKRREIIASYFNKVDEVLSDYLRGAMIVAFIQGIISATVLSILGVKYALVLGIMTALLDFIPYVGLLISLVVGTIVAMFSGDQVTGKVIGVIVMYLSQKIFENTILAPKIIGDKVGLHPVILILSLFVFGYFMGFVGLLVAVPTTAVIVMFVKLWQNKKLSVISTNDISI
ncbi:MAG: AI-2E family transporter [Ignavibacteriales bacterium]|nr:AI-2E family transporter [Ignavibacteriales bacterium]